MSLVGAGRPEPGSGAERACPSASCTPGAALLGVATPAGRLAFLPVPLVVDRDLAEQLRGPGRAESRYRFTGPCAEGGCPQWTGSGCEVIDHVLDGPVDRPAGAGDPLPACGIRADCRWFAQRGADACRACPTLVADLGGSVITLREPRA
ncbi:hypothetical protein [Streptomyces sp. TLI_171]|uniref:hypothetical protein n=1 Tax=Streptomyces sp. TLI_171 TaxID=1938859 RepID=UPI00117EDBEC|nr:hypothetical protein [Streptomyces sp. TLI_171]